MAESYANEFIRLPWYTNHCRKVPKNLPVPTLTTPSSSIGVSRVSIRSCLPEDTTMLEATTATTEQDSSTLAPPTPKAKSRRRSVVSSIANMMSKTFGFATNKKSTSCPPTESSLVAGGLIMSTNMQPEQDIVPKNTKDEEILSANANIAVNGTTEEYLSLNRPSCSSETPTTVLIVQDPASSSSSSISNMAPLTDVVNSLQVERSPTPASLMKKQSNDSGAYFDSPPPSPSELTALQRNAIEEIESNTSRDKSHGSSEQLTCDRESDKGNIAPPTVVLGTECLGHEFLHEAGRAPEFIPQEWKRPIVEDIQKTLKQKEKKPPPPKTHNNLVHSGSKKQLDHSTSNPTSEKGPQRKSRTQRVYGHRVVPQEKRAHKIKP